MKNPQCSEEQEKRVSPEIQGQVSNVFPKNQNEQQDQEKVQPKQMQLSKSSLK